VSGKNAPVFTRSTPGTGLQAVASRLASLGEGISHGIGVGGRDLSAEVGGVMTAFAVEALGADGSRELAVGARPGPPSPGSAAEPDRPAPDRGRW